MYTRIQNEKGHPIVRIMNNKGKEFNIVEFHQFCESYVTTYELLALRTPQQNGVTR